MAALTLALIIPGGYVLAQTPKAPIDIPQSYVLTLLYNNGKLDFPDDDSSIDPSLEPYAAPAPKNYLFYTAELYDQAGNVVAIGPIDQKQNFGQVVDPAYGPENAWVRITAPYDAAATRIVIKDYSRQTVFEQPLYNTTVLAKPETDEVFPQAVPVAAPSFWHSNWVLGILIAAVILVGSLLVYIVLRYYRSHS